MGGGGGGSISVKLFSISYMLNSNNSVFQSYSLIGTYLMRKTFFEDNSRVEPTIFFMEKY